MVKIDIISGFLGAGKTTFIKRILKTDLNKERVVLIENEFGEISIDGEFLADQGIKIRELSQGCICCSLVGDFSKSLKDVINEFSPERIIIEPSGVGKLSDVTKAVIDAGLGENLNSMVCLVDAKKAKMYMKNFGEFFKDQILNASTIVLSRSDIASDLQIKEAINLIRDINKEANLVVTPINDLSDKALFNAYEGIKEDLLHELLAECEEEHEDKCHHHHDEDDCDCHDDHHNEDECFCCHHDEVDEDDYHHHHDGDECDCHDDHHNEDECFCCHHDEVDEDDCHHHHDGDECDCHDDHHNEDECFCCHHDEVDEDDCHHHHDEDECDCHEHHHHHHGHDADEVFTSFGLEVAKEYDYEQFCKLLNELAMGKHGIVVRAKGFVNTTHGWYEFNVTMEEVSLDLTTAKPIGKIVVIGSKLDEKAIRELF